MGSGKGQTKRVSTTADAKPKNKTWEERQPKPVGRHKNLDGYEYDVYEQEAKIIKQQRGFSNDDLHYMRDAIEQLDESYYYGRLQIEKDWKKEFLQAIGISPSVLDYPKLSTPDFDTIWHRATKEAGSYQMKHRNGSHGIIIPEKDLEEEEKLSLSYTNLIVDAYEQGDKLSKDERLIVMNETEIISEKATWNSRLGHWKNLKPFFEEVMEEVGYKDPETPDDWEIPSYKKIYIARQKYKQSKLDPNINF